MSGWQAVLVGYALGSLPIGYLLVHRARGVDLRRAGSGNVGAANVFRTAGWRFGLAVVVVDLAKGAVAVAITGSGDSALAAGMAAVLGQVFPVWLRGKGGRGVATATGAFGVLSPVATAFAVLVFAATVFTTRYVSLGSVLAATSLPLAVWVVGGAGATTLAAAAVAALIVLRHRDNLGRLWSGTERTVGQ